LHTYLAFLVFESVASANFRKDFAQMLASKQRCFISSAAKGHLNFVKSRLNGSNIRKSVGATHGVQGKFCGITRGRCNFSRSGKLPPSHTESERGQDDTYA